MPRLPKTLVLSVAAVALPCWLLGCADEVGINPAPSPPVSAPADAAADSPMDPPDANPGTPSFESSGTAVAGAIALMPGVSREDGNVAVDIVLGAHEDVYGVAAGLTWDGSGLQYIGFTSSALLEGEEGIRAATENPAGRLVLVWTRTGKAVGAKVDTTMTLGTVVFRPKKTGTWPVRFLPSITRARTSSLDLATATPTYVGGDVQAP